MFPGGACFVRGGREQQLLISLTVASPVKRKKKNYERYQSRILDHYCTHSSQQSVFYILPYGRCVPPCIIITIAMRYAAFHAQAVGSNVDGSSLLCGTKAIVVFRVNPDDDKVESRMRRLRREARRVSSLLLLLVV